MKLQGKKFFSIIKWQQGAKVKLKKRSWETQKDYQERLKNYSTEREREKQEFYRGRIRQREQFANSSEGQKRKEAIAKHDNAFFKNIKVKPQKGLSRQADLIKAADNNIKETVKTLNGVNTAIKNQEQEKQNKVEQYKNMAEAVATAAELGLSGASLLRAYGNWRNWKTSSNLIRRGIINFLNKNQVPLQATGTLIDGTQTYNDISNGNHSGALWNGAGTGLGIAGTIGATDIFRSSKYFNPKLDVVFDIAGLLQNAGDIGKFAWDAGNRVFRYVTNDNSTNR